MTTPNDEIRPEDGSNSFRQYRRYLTPSEVAELMELDEEEKIYRQEYERVKKLAQHHPTFEDLAGKPAFQDDYWAQRKNEIRRKAMLAALQDKDVP